MMIHMNEYSSIYIYIYTTTILSSIQDNVVCTSVYPIVHLVYGSIVI